MKIVVLKFGGTSVGTTGRIKKVALVKKVDKRLEKWVIKNQQYVTDKKSSGSINISSGINITHLPEQKKKKLIHFEGMCSSCLWVDLDKTW